MRIILIMLKFHLSLEFETSGTGSKLPFNISSSICWFRHSMLPSRFEWKRRSRKDSIDLSSFFSYQTLSFWIFSFKICNLTIGPLRKRRNIDTILSSCCCDRDGCTISLYFLRWSNRRNYSKRNTCENVFGKIIHVKKVNYVLRS